MIETKDQIKGKRTNTTTFMLKNGRNCENQTNIERINE